MNNFVLNPEGNEVEAVGVSGYILLYLDNMPHMRWRFQTALKIKLVLEKEKSTVIPKHLASANYTKHTNAAAESDDSFNFQCKVKEIEKGVTAASISCSTNKNMSTAIGSVPQSSTCVLDNDEQYPLGNKTTAGKLCATPLSKPRPQAVSVSAHLQDCHSSMACESNELFDKEIYPLEDLPTDGSLNENMGTPLDLKDQATCIAEEEHKSYLENPLCDEKTDITCLTNNEELDELPNDPRNDEISNEQMCASNSKRDYGSGSKVTASMLSGRKLTDEFKSSTATSSVLTDLAKTKVDSSTCSSPLDSLAPHPIFKPVVCKFCNKTFLGQERHRAHLTTMALKLQCSSCNTILGSKAEKIVHEHLDHSAALTSGVNKSEALNFPSSAKGDKLDMPQKRSRQFVLCPICGIRLRVGNLVNHVRNKHTKEGIYRCCLCDFSTSTYRILQKHQLTHETVEHRRARGHGRWHCSLCPAVFSSASDCRLHQGIHRRVCVFCKEEFVHIGLLRRHYTSQHWDSMLPCKVCGERVATKQQLWTHERHHRYSKPEPCHICGKMFRQLKNHMVRVHGHTVDQEPSGSKTDAVAGRGSFSGTGGGSNIPKSSKFQCSSCPKTFVSEGHLIRHQNQKHKENLTHTFRCPMCSHVFPTRLKLSKHIRRHLKKKSEGAICQVCGKYCSMKYNLAIHMRIHAPEKCFSCHICNQGFNYKASLEGHLKSKHGIGKNE